MDTLSQWRSNLVNTKKNSSVLRDGMLQLSPMKNKFETQELEEATRVPCKDPFDIAFFTKLKEPYVKIRKGQRGKGSSCLNP